MEDNQIFLQDEQNGIETVESIDVIDVYGTETYDIDLDAAFPALGESNDDLKHQLLNGKELPDQHPITAITGLRDELDVIEALQVVYSNEKNHADYYLWWDENPLQEVREGLFVTLCEDTNKIQLCTEVDNIFGVTVDTAAFVGGQDDVARDCKYGLVANSGVAMVRCESSVEVGSYVISNNYGFAKTSDTDYGYKVFALAKFGDVVYAVISLDIPANLIYTISKDVDELEERMTDAEMNIVATMNVANEAYNKALDAGSISDDAIQQAIEALNKVTEATDKADKIQANFAAAELIANQAHKLAEDASIAAERIREEAVATANQALSDVSDMIASLDGDIEQVHNDVGEARDKANKAVDDLAKLQTEMEPLSTWSGDTGVGFAGFVAQADENASAIADLVSWKNKTDDGTIESLVGIEKRVSDTEAILNEVASYKKENTDGTSTDGFAGLIAQVDANKSELTAVADYTYKDSDGEVIASGLAGLTSQVEANASAIKLFAGFNDGNVDNIGELAMQVSSNEAAINSLTNWKSDAADMMASTKNTADANKASIIALTSADTELNKTMTSIQQQSDANGASIELLAASVDKYSVGEYSQSYGLTHAQAVSILKEGTIYVPTKHSDTNKSHTEKFSDTGETNSFTPGAYYIWKNGDWVEDTSTVTFSSSKPSTSGQLKYWYIDSASAPTGYEPHALYVLDGGDWKKVNVLSGNASNRATSMIRQTVDSINVEVTNARGSAATLGARLTNTESTVQTVASWTNTVQSDVATIKQTADSAGASIAQVVSGVGTGGKVTAASIVTAINNQTGSSINLNANRINFEGAVTANGTFSIDKSGYMTATGGHIGGWDITSSTIQHPPNANGQYKNGVAMKTGGDYAFVAGSDNLNDNTNAKFKVWHTGKLEATEAEITGTITAKAGSKIGAWTLGDTTLKAGGENGQKVVAIQVPNNKGYYAFAVGGASHADYSDCPFRVDFNGMLTARNANIEGTITAGSGSNIGGWDITSTNIQKQHNLKRLYLCSNPGSDYNSWIAVGTRSSTSSDWSWPFYVLHDGTLGATKANITGTITANAGSKIGPWTLGDTTMKAGGENGQKVVAMQVPNANGAYAFAVGGSSHSSYSDCPFRVSFDGSLYSTRGEIGGWTITSTTIQSGNTANSQGVALKTGGDYAFVAGSNNFNNNSGAAFKVWHTGKLEATNAIIKGNITATDGNIGGWLIQDNALRSVASPSSSNRGVAIKSGGTYAIVAGSSDWDNNQRAPFWVKHNGDLYAASADIEGKITATAGNIGGWTISARPSSGTSYNGGIYADHTIGSDIYRVGMKLPLVGESNPGNVSAFYVTKNPLSKNASGASATPDYIFAVQNNGKLVAKNAEIDGYVNATTGFIGGWKIEDGSLTSQYYSETPEPFVANGKTHYVTYLYSITLNASGLYYYRKCIHPVTGEWYVEPTVGGSWHKMMDKINW